MQTSLEECARLKEEMKEEMSIEDHDYDDASLDKDIRDRLRKVHECRTEKMPGPLVNAIQSRGTLFSGPEAVSEYVALPLPQCHSSCQNTEVHSTPPVLLIRGEHDFVTEECIKGWRKIFAPIGDQRGIKYREEIMHNCSHYCHLEDGQRFGGLVKNHCFINDY